MASSGSQINVDIWYVDGREVHVTWSLRAMVAFELAFEKSYAEGLVGAHGQTWMTWRTLQLAGDPVGSYDEWLDTVSHLFIEVPPPPKRIDAG